MTDGIFQQFSKGNGNANADPMVWGGKGAGLAQMAAKGYPVPPGFTITTELCKAYQEQPEAVMDAIMTDIDDHLKFIHDQFGYMPLLSVRSGAPVSMPGMMDTILNVGMNDNERKNWLPRIGERATWDSWRRLVQMMGTTCFGLPNEAFEARLEVQRSLAGVETDAELSVKDLQKVFDGFRKVYADAGIAMPVTLKEQLRICIDTVFRSWMGPNAIEYRKIEGIDDSLGTAVTVQAMVFGNMNDKSGSGVLFTRDPSTGEKKIFAEYLANAQGEDVVAGIRTPDQLELSDHTQYSSGSWKDTLAVLCQKLEEDYRDMVDAEFTVQDGELFMLQSRIGKRSAQAAFKIAWDLKEEGVISEEEALSRVKRKHFLTLRRPSISLKHKKKPDLQGMGASQGIAIGEVVFTSSAAVEQAKQGKKVILVTHETTPDDIAGMAASVGILTKTGGATSHAAVVARGMDKPCVVGCKELFTSGKLDTGMTISIDGATGRVWLGEVPVVGGDLTTEAKNLVDALLAKHSILPQADTPVPNSTVVLAEWVFQSDAQIDELVKLLVSASQGGMVVLDITPPTKFGSDADEMIWAIAGKPLEAEAFGERVLHKVLHSSIERENCRVVGGGSDMRELFALKEFDVLPQISTLHELLDQKGMVGLDPFLVKFIAPDGDVRPFLKALADKDLFKGQVVTGSLPAAYAVLQLLGE